MHHLGTDHNVSQKLTVIGIIVHRKSGYFSRFSDIMHDRCRDQKIAVQHTVGFDIILAKPCYT